MFNIKKITCRIFSTALALCISVGSIGVFSDYSRVIAAPASNQDATWPACPDLYGVAGCLIEASTGTVLFEKKAHDRMYPASITKILTALVTLENSGLGEEVSFSEECVNSLSYDDANMAMQAGEILPVEDCLYGLMLKSANEVATALGEHVAGTSEEFAKMMTQRAKEAGALDSNFMNANGLHNDNHYITAYDMCMITRAAIANPVFLTISGTTGYTVSASNYKDPFEIYNRHKMLFKESGYYYEGILGGKTGFTDQAGTTLVTYAQRDGMTLIATVLNSNGYNVYEDTKLLLDYGFNNFSLANASNNETRFTTEDTNYNYNLPSLFGDNDISSLFIDTKANIVLPKNIDFSSVDSSFSYDTSGQLDSRNNSIVATINYSFDNHKIGTANVLLNGDDIIPPDKVGVTVDDSNKKNNNKAKFKLPTIKINKKIIKSLFTILIFTIVIAVIVTLIKRKQKQLNEIRARKRRRNY